MSRKTGAGKANPFGDFDFQDFFTSMNLPNVDFENFVAGQKKNIEAMVSANQTLAQGCQAVATRQAELAGASIADAQTRLNALMAGGFSKEDLADQSAAAGKSVEEASKNLREVLDLVQKSQTEALEILRRRVSEGLGEAKGQAKDQARDVKDKS